MSTRIILLGILSFAIAGAALWYSPTTQRLVTNAIANVPANGLYILAAVIILILALAFIFTRSKKTARNRKRELDEYMRVAQQTASKEPQTFKREVVSAAPGNGLDSRDSKVLSPPEPAQPSVKAGCKPKKRQIAEPEFSKISDDLYFQPVTNMTEGQIIGYEIYRQATQTSRQNPNFVQHTPSASIADRTEFEYSTLEKTASATKHKMWADIAQTSEISFFVQISDALLDDKSLWRRAASTLRKQSQSNPSITLSIRSSSFAGSPQKTINERLQKLKRLQNSGVPLALHGFQNDHQLVTEDGLSSFYLSICDKEELLCCYDGNAATDINLAYQQIVKSSLGISVQGIVSETDVVDCLAAGAKFMSGDYLAPPRKLKTEASTGSEAGEQNTYG